MPWATWINSSCWAAGYDTRAYGEPKQDGLAIFELDRARTQELKVASLGKAGIDAARVTFVPVDFSRDDAFKQLRGRRLRPDEEDPLPLGGGNALLG